MWNSQQASMWLWGGVGQSESNKGIIISFSVYYSALSFFNEHVA